LRYVEVKEVKETVKRLFLQANLELGEGVLEALKRAREEEKNALAKRTLDLLIENALFAKAEGLPICQDTGLAIVIMEIGQGIAFKGGSLREAVEEGVREAYSEGFFRKSVCHPFSRKNTGDNTPVILHLEVTEGDKVRVIVFPKGGGSENKSLAQVLPPYAGREGVVEFVLKTVKEAGPDPCPPLIIGVGIGGNLETSSLLAKKALLRPLGKPNPDPELQGLEEEILRKVNALGIGPQGFGGMTTALACHVMLMPCHIASLPVSVNLQCHAHRWKEAYL